jgi:HAE1 family hydrophobic/amphiphilic exporter-1
MKLIDMSLKNGTAVVVAMILVVLFGLAALSRIPVQLNPTIDSPIISIRTDYPGAAALEVESEITLRQEQRLATVQNLRKIRSESEEGEAQIELEFEWGVDKDSAVVDINTKLGSVRDLPDEAEKPVIYASDSEEYNSVIRITVQSDLPVNEVREIMEDNLGPRLERIEGVGRVRWYGGARREIQVLLDLSALDARNVSINDVRAALRRENQNRRGGDIEEGDSRVVLRTVGQYTDLNQIRRTVVKNGPEGVIRIDDVAEVVDGFEDPESIGGTMGKPSVGVSISKISGANTISVCKQVVAEVERINEENRESGLFLWVNYDSSDYIWDAVARVSINLLIGAVAATLVLFLFLRSFVSTLAIGLTIPLCLIGTFTLLAAFDRSLNVISLAGLAFAAGMVVDNAVVVMENIVRHSRLSKASPVTVAREATGEVWAPILASSLTTLVVFIPILFIREQAGQLFRDIAYSISFAVVLSMFASITVIPMLASRLFGKLAKSRPENGTAARSPGPLVRMGLAVQGLFASVVKLGVRKKGFRFAFLGAATAMFFLSLQIIPPAEYLPQSKSSKVFGRLSNPAGVSLEGAKRQLDKIETFTMNEVDHLYRMFSYARHSSSFFGIYLEEEYATAEAADKAIADLEAHAKKVLPSDFRFSAYRVSDFGWRFEGKRIEVEFSGPDLEKLHEMSLDIEEQLRLLPEVKEVFSSFQLSNPELQVYPDRDRLADLGMSASDVADAVETIMEGSRTSYYREGGKEYYIVLKARKGQMLHADALRGLLLTTPKGDAVRLNEVATIRKQLGPDSIEHVNKERTITLRINIHDGTPLQTFIEKTKNEVLIPFKATMADRYKVPATSYRAELAGSADDLRRTMEALSQSLLFALVISYLLMTALFQSFKYPLIILFSVPLAMTGGFLGVWIGGVEFNVITMLGFVLLAGIVVNNAILLVDFTLRSVRNGVEVHEAALEAVRVRMRPIFMTSSTTALGMLPLALGRGVGTELYSGLGCAVVGGLALSTIFTLIIIPLLLTTALEFRNWRMRGKTAA